MSSEQYVMGVLEGEARERGLDGGGVGTVSSAESAEPPSGHPHLSSPIKGEGLPDTGGTPVPRLRMRRLDRHCFVLERRSGSGGSWAVDGYFNTPAAMCRAALRNGIVGDSAEELLASVDAAEARVMDALLQAVTSGALSKGAGSARGGHRANTRPTGTDLGAGGSD